MERKDFIKKFAVGGSVLLSAPVIFSSCSDDSEDLEPINPPGSTGEITIDLTAAAYADLAVVGGYAYKGDIIIFRTNDSSYLALSKVCTHASCTISYSHANGNLPCACHGSVFSTAGAVQEGPANSNLKKYTVQKTGNTLTIS
jgi:cytochrome b6-f complex iron-sulfur subunit